ncbi:hypothetical protein SAMN05216386_2957 [Nitrosospira briensis]|uniref:Uncharacterized protein n=1 Tax=Nitrosospira briensis TaxID=35799 RepID=A0A1I5FCC2_9PROT|nr:hypothetical protein [Nitrosospira briensis]SFO21404.1 hypothetical protein SAMN05216386_2957 [Nitrosospira briensis]
MERIIAIIAIALSTLSGTLGLILSFFGILTISPDIWFSYTLTVVSIFMAYVFWWCEKHQKILKKISETSYDGLEIFYDSRSFLERVTDLTVGAKSIRTVNLSDTPDSFHHLESYFSAIHTYIKTSNKLISFRRIAGIQNDEKAVWLLSSSSSLINTSRLSVAFADMRHPHGIDLCFHIVDREDGKYTFIFPSVDLTGQMPAVLFRNDLVAQSMATYFDNLWNKLPHLHEGKKIRMEAFVILEDWFPGLKENTAYKAAKTSLASKI